MYERHIFIGVLCKSSVGCNNFFFSFQLQVFVSSFNLMACSLGIHVVIVLIHLALILQFCVVCYCFCLYIWHILLNIILFIFSLILNFFPNVTMFVWNISETIWIFLVICAYQISHASSVCLSVYWTESLLSFYPLTLAILCVMLNGYVCFTFLLRKPFLLSYLLITYYPISLNFCHAPLF